MYTNHTQLQSKTSTRAFYLFRATPRDNNHRETHANTRCLPFNLSHKLPPRAAAAEFVRDSEFLVVGSPGFIEIRRVDRSFAGLFLRRFDVSSARFRVISTIRKLGREGRGNAFSNKPEERPSELLFPEHCRKEPLFASLLDIFPKKPATLEIFRPPPFISRVLVRVGASLCHAEIVVRSLSFYVYSSLFTHGRSRV